MNCIYITSISAEYLLQYLSILIMIIAFGFSLFKGQLRQRIKSVSFNNNFFLFGMALAVHISIVLLNAQFKDEDIKPYATQNIEEDFQVVPVTRWNPPKAKPIRPPAVKKTKLEKTIFKPIVTQEILQKPLLNLEISADDVVELPSSKEPVAEMIHLPQPEETEADVILIPERMPRFPGCEDLSKTTQEREACAKRLLLEYMHDNINYPSLAKDNLIEGTVVIQFVVTTSGQIDNIKIVRDIGGGCGQEAARVVRSMNEFDTLWTPGKQRGRPVNVLFTLPINFKLGN